MKFAATFLGNMFLILSSAAYAMDPQTKESLLIHIENDENKKHACTIMDRIPLKVWKDAYSELSDLFKHCQITRTWITSEELFAEAQQFVIKLFDAMENNPRFTEQDCSHLVRITKTIFKSDSLEYFDGAIGNIKDLLKIDDGATYFLSCMPFLKDANIYTINYSCLALDEALKPSTVLPAISTEDGEKLIKIGYPLLELLTIDTTITNQLLIALFQSREESRDKISTIINNMVACYNDISPRYLIDIFYRMINVKDLNIIDAVFSKIIFLYKKCTCPSHGSYLRSALSKSIKEHGALTLLALSQAESDLREKLAAK